MPRHYAGIPDDPARGPGRLGVLLCNLGTPAAPTPSAVRRYLAEFLADPRVIELPRWVWLPVLHGVILNLRPRRSARAYAEIWTTEGSPLLVNSERLRGALAQQLAGALPAPAEVALGMRYGAPSIGQALRTLAANGSRRLLVLPLYPQYSATSTGSALDAIAAELACWRRVPELRWIADYHDEPAYIDALAGSVRAHWAAGGRGEHLVLSFHGIPARYAAAGDPYPGQCHATAAALAGRLGLHDGEWTATFQSRFGPQAWVEPYTVPTLEALAGAGVRRVDVLCPGFAADCLETLEEIAIRARESFAAAGGEALRYIPALNDSPAHAAALADLVVRHTQGWALSPLPPTATRQP